jgi:chorismate lyase/3-hydroxybenzoate synthase
MRGEAASLVSVTVPGIVDLGAEPFEQRAFDAYQTLRRTLNEMDVSAPVRFWNYLPAIRDRMEDRGDRYVVFNAGRFRALTDWYGGRANLPGRLPTASGVGHAGRDLVIHCLALARPGESVENPRQISAWDYSKRYGALPPCFARATVVTSPLDGSRALLVGGTASVRGEQTVHFADLSRQLDETMVNLRSLLAATNGASDLRGFAEVRAYYARADDRAKVQAAVGAAFGAEATVEIVPADLCRADLLVEIEGLATLKPRSDD